MAKVENLVNGTKASPLSMFLIEKCQKEVSFFGELCGVYCKVRADGLHLAKETDPEEDFSYILDLKSMSGNAKNTYSMRSKISTSNYDLSASFYTDLVNKYITEYNKTAKVKYRPVTHFFWTFASKDFIHAKTYYASPKMMEVGRKKYQRALYLINKYSKNNWVFEDSVDMLEPSFYEEEWLNTKVEDEVKPDGIKYSPKQQVKEAKPKTKKSQEVL
jgi:hypothetical protein